MKPVGFVIGDHLKNISVPTNDSGTRNNMELNDFSQKIQNKHKNTKYVLCSMKERQKVENMRMSK